MKRRAPGTGAARPALPGGTKGFTHVWCWQAGGLERSPGDSARFKPSKGGVRASLDGDALHGVVLVGDLNLGPRGELPLPSRPQWLKAACEVSMGDEW